MTNGHTTELRDNGRAIIRLRVLCLMKLINTRKVPKKRLKKIRRELFGYGILLLREKREIVSVKMDDGVFFSKFAIDGKIGHGMDAVLGFYCPHCQRIWNVKDRVIGVGVEPTCRLTYCKICGSYDLMDVLPSNVVEYMDGTEKHGMRYQHIG